MRKRLCVLIAMWLTSCSGPTQIPAPDATGEQIAAWVAGPTSARIRLMYEFSNPTEIGYKARFSRQLGNFFGGSANQRLIRPYALDENEKIIAIADPGAGSIYILDKQRESFSVIGDSEPLRLASPVGVALGNERLFVADSALGKVFVLNQRQRLVDTLEQFNRPTSLAFDHQNQRLLVTDTLGHEILVLDQEGNLINKIGRRGKNAGEFNYPSHICVAGDYLYVLDTMNFRVQKFSLDGQYISHFGVHGDSPGHLAQPKGIAVDSEDNVFLSESVFGRIQVFNSNGNFLLDFGTLGDESGNFNLPAGLLIKERTLYVADSGNGRIQVFELTPGN